MAEAHVLGSILKAVALACESKNYNILQCVCVEVSNNGSSLDVVGTDSYMCAHYHNEGEVASFGDDGQYLIPLSLVKMIPAAGKKQVLIIENENEKARVWCPALCDISDELGAIVGGKNFPNWRKLFENLAPAKEGHDYLAAKKMETISKIFTTAYGTRCQYKLTCGYPFVMEYLDNGCGFTVILMPIRR